MAVPKKPDKLTTSQVSKFLPEYLNYVGRIQKTLYYGHLPKTDRPSLPFTRLCVDKFSSACRRGLDILDVRTASMLSYNACPTPASLIIALVYLERLNPEYLTSTPPSRVFLVAMMVASKFLYDDGEDDEVFNDEWANSASLSVQDLNQAERDFLKAIDWNLFVSNDSFLQSFERVEAEVAVRESLMRDGHFTYTDVNSLMQALALSTSCTAFIKLLSHVLAVCIVSYTAGVVSMLAGTILGHQSCHTVSNHITSLGLSSQDTSNLFTGTYQDTAEEMENKSLPTCLHPPPQVVSSWILGPPPKVNEREKESWGPRYPTHSPPKLDVGLSWLNDPPNSDPPNSLLLEGLVSRLLGPLLLDALIPQEMATDKIHPCNSITCRLSNRTQPSLPPSRSLPPSTSPNRTLIYWNSVKLDCPSIDQKMVYLKN